MVHTSTATPVSSRSRLPSARDLRVAAAVCTLVVLFVVVALVLPSAGLLLFLAVLTLLFVLPFAVVAGVVDGLDPAM